MFSLVFNAISIDILSHFETECVYAMFTEAKHRFNGSMKIIVAYCFYQNIDGNSIEYKAEHP
jgi:hypothetical protein